MDNKKLFNECIELSKENCRYAFEVMEEPKITNRLYKKLRKKYTQLKSIENTGINNLSELLTYDNDYVQYCAAARYLPIDEKRAKTVLNKLISKYEKTKGGLGIFCFSMEMLIEEWDKGNLRNHL